MLRLGRRAGVALHWATAVLTLAVAVASDPGQSRVLGAVFAIVAVAFVGRAALVGPLSRPGPRLSGPVRAIHLVLHRGLMVVLLGVVATGLATGMAGPALAEKIGQDSAAMALWHSRLFAALFALAAGHLVFNIWRGVALGERPFARMLP